MEFRLTYEGILKGSGNNSNQTVHKHDIRRIFHKQLKHLFTIHPAYGIFQPLLENDISSDNFIAEEAKQNDQNYQKLIKQFNHNGYKFLPLVTHNLSLMCSINILFLRPDTPGRVIKSGDLDNRIKTIFDSLRMPLHGNELKGNEVPGENETPFFCLLEDDSLISHASIEADTLLQPTGESWGKNDARLVITVGLSRYKHTWENTGFV